MSLKKKVGVPEFSLCEEFTPLDRGGERETDRERDRETGRHTHTHTHTHPGFDTTRLSNSHLWLRFASSY
jgi:ABC-type Zn2+ transport system substrate-binding protein/surface adhesin